MKRFLLFGNTAYYPEGGWRDFLGSFAAVEDAKAFGDLHSKNSSWWWHIVDSHTGLVVERGYHE